MDIVTGLPAPAGDRCSRYFTRRHWLRSLFLVFPALLFWQSPAVHAATWEQAAQVAYMEKDSPIPDHEVAAAIDYAVAAWSSRLDVQLDATTLPAVAGYREGVIVIRWLDTLQMVQGGSDILSVATTRRWLYTGTTRIAGAEIFLRRDSSRLRYSACLKHVILHELGHALGLGHLTTETAVMHAGLQSCHHTLTAEDIAAAPYTQHICHAELLSDFDIYIPIINVGEHSYAARLEYQQGVWSVVESRQTTRHPECMDAWLDADTLMLDKVWTPEHVWQGELERSGNAWHLVSAF